MNFNMRIKRALFLLIVFFIAENAEAQNSARIYGKVVNTEGIPIESAGIWIKEFPNISISTTESGKYELLVPHDREITVVVSHVSYLPQEKKITTVMGKRIPLDFELSFNDLPLPKFTIIAIYTDHTGLEKIDPRHLKHIPTLNSGVESIVKSQIGVFGNNELSSQYNVRGGNYDENLIYLNDMEIYRPFLIRSGQQEGLSFINPDLVSGIKFSSGGFEALYGDKMSSVLDVQYRKPTKFGASISGSLLGATGHIEGISKDSTFTALFGARYQSNAYIFNKLNITGDYRPNFTDVQLLLSYTPKKKWEFQLFGNYARNTYRLTPEKSIISWGALNNVKKLTVYFDGQEVDAYQTVFASFTTKYWATPHTNFKLILSYFNTQEKETFDIEGKYFMGEVSSEFGDTAYGKEISSRDVGADIHHGRNFLNAHIFHGELRGEHRFKKSVKNTFEWGIKGQGEFVDDRLSEWRLYDSAGISLPHIYTVPGDTVPFDDPSRIITMGDNYLKVKNTIHTFRLSGFLQDKWVFGSDTANNKFILIGGVRFSYWTFNQEVIVTPRIRLIYQPKIADISFYLATGMYFQPAFYKEMRQPDGTLNLDIKAQKSYHIILGADYLFKVGTRPFKITAETYYKHLWNLTTYALDNVRVIYSGLNDADGYAVGIDAKLSGEFVNNLESWVTFSLMRTMERIDGGEYHPRPTDQRFAIHLFVQDKVPKLPTLKAHINLYYASPLPYCLPNSRNYTGRPNSVFFRTDIGFSWQFIDAATYVGKLKVLNAGYLTFEIANLSNYKNILSYSFVAAPTVIDGYEQYVYYRVPNYLTPRLFNVKLRLEF